MKPSSPEERQRIIDAILGDIEQGVSLKAACEYPDRISRKCFFEWIEKDAELRDRYERARERRADYFNDEIIEIVDTEPDPARARVRMDARKWSASKMNPRRYGDRAAVEMTGKDGGPIETADMTPLELARRVAFALEKGKRAL